MIKIMTDSTCDLTQELLEQNDISVLPLYVNFLDESFKDGIEIDVPTMIEKITNEKVMPKTSAVSQIDFHKAFKEQLEAGKEIIYLSIGSKFSATYQNAVITKNELESDKVHIIDTMNLSSGIGLLVLKACKLRDQGLSAEEIIKEVERCVPLVRTQFAINTLDYLHKGGRCSGTAKIFGTMLKLKPIIRVIDGGMVVAKKPLGKFSRALNVILDYVKHDLGNIDEDNMMITHCLADDDAKYLDSEVANLSTGVRNVYETKAGCVISSHCGPRTIGILYILKQ